MKACARSGSNKRRERATGNPERASAAAGGPYCCAPPPLSRLTLALALEVASYRVPTRFHIGVVGTRQTAAYRVALGAKRRPSLPDLNRGRVALHRYVATNMAGADRIGPGSLGVRDEDTLDRQIPVDLRLGTDHEGARLGNINIAGGDPTVRERERAGVHGNVAINLAVIDKSSPSIDRQISQELTRLTRRSIRAPLAEG
jgi:hypothetical protein